MPSSSVEVLWPALRRAWGRAEFEEVWFQFRPHNSHHVLPDVKAAVAAANRAVESAGWGEDVFAEGTSDSDAGPVALLSRAGPEPGVRAWFDHFARELANRGQRGKVTAAPQAHFPEWLDGLGPQLTGFVAYRTVDLAQLTEMERRGGWHIPPALTDRIARAAVEWGQFPGADVYLSRNIHLLRTQDPDVTGPLADGISRFGLAGVNYLRSAPRRMNSVNLSAQGLACYGALDDSASWQDRLSQVTRAIRGLPNEADLAFVRYSHAYTISWSELATSRPRLPFVREHQVRYNRHLLAQYTPDAHGVQVLTDAHLHRAHDLSDWTVESLSGDRHLVTAKDLGVWYAQPDPVPASLEKARRDFGGMILTPETIANNPPPWR